MLTFKSFLRYSLTEELTPEQKKEVSRWIRDPKALAHTDHFFGKGNVGRCSGLEIIQAVFQGFGHG